MNESKLRLQCPMSFAAQLLEHPENADSVHLGKLVTQAGVAPFLEFN